MSAKGRAYDHIKNNILRGDWPAHEAIVADVVAASLGISRIPVREAIAQLEAEGLVTIGDTGRSRVTSLTIEEIVELFEIRVALEGLAMERAAPRIQAQDIADLEQLLQQMRAVETNIHEWLKLHAEFHDRIYQVSGMRQLVAQIGRVRQSIHPYIMIYSKAYRGPEMSDASHQSLVAVLKSRDPGLARAAIADHVRSAAEGIVYHLVNTMQPLPFYPVP